MDTGEVCIANIGPRERQKRLVFGLGSLAVSAVITGALVVGGVNVWWRLGLFLPFALAFTGIFQWREKT